jgi:hypothetical protein
MGCQCGDSWEIPTGFVSNLGNSVFLMGQIMFFPTQMVVGIP